jgi:hypothetical protein
MITIMEGAQQNNLFPTASSKCYLDHASITTTWDTLLRNFYLIFQLIDRIGSVFVVDIFRFLNIFKGNIKEITHLCLCKSPYNTVCFVVTRVHSHEMQAYSKLCPIYVF